MTFLLLNKGTSPLDMNQWLLDFSMNKVDAHDYAYGAIHEGFHRVIRLQISIYLLLFDNIFYYPDHVQEETYITS